MKYQEVNLHLRIPRPEVRFDRQGLAKWLPSRGNVLFTLVMIAVLLWAQSAGAVPFRAESAASTGTIAYQGRLADSSGNPLTQTLAMSFRLYNAATGGAPLWTEQWTGSNGVQVSDDLFNVMLGSLTPIPQSVITGNSTLFLGITVGTDDEMVPRVQLGSVPFAVQALTVPDGSITKAKLAADVVESLQQGPIIQAWRSGLITVGGSAGSVSSPVRWTFPTKFTETPHVVASISENFFCYYCSVRLHAITPEFAEFIVERHVGQGTPSEGGTGMVWAVAIGE